ncbi:LANO_0D03400g1_1 [Lachancea nothofagi CBS 11611]|uniref:DNA polymerase eta n=1 Tax=Lachancea nothofagi CBS 11611 TaxID=1266666 RepID=A0A1G4JF75_9SACH|nr:LANO_0D03400g1_1 [Lachancea nothofagi CBS 11611]
MSEYRWKDLLDINSKSKAYLSPLSCIAHIDVNAFFAQVEQIRCHYNVEDPVVCVQWNSIIAVSYAARKFGITRMDSVFDALKKCSNLVPIHTAVFRKGEDFWQYHDDCGSWHTEEEKRLTPEKFKVSLDPYRRESRKVIKIFHEWCDMVEKASVDEVFLDLGRNVFATLLLGDEVKGFESIRDQFKNGEYELDDYLPTVPRDLDIQFDPGDYNPENEFVFQDWDDVLFCLGSKITDKIRQQIIDVLGYTTSCGIARTRTMAKLGSNFKKPNAQTVIRNRNIGYFLDNGSFELTSFWSMGGIMGKELSTLLELPKEKPLRYIRESWPMASSDVKAFMKEKIAMLADDTERSFNLSDEQCQQLSEKIFLLARGDFKMPMNPRPMIRSMMSNKNLRGESCRHYQDCLAWLEVFSGELIGRIKELEQEYERIFIPKTMTISTRTPGFQRHSRSSGLVVGGRIKAKDLMELGTRLTKELDTKFGNTKDYYPLTNINMVISNFEILETGRTIVDMFGRQTQVIRKSGDDFVKPSDNHSNSDDCEIKRTLRCEPCDMDFETELSFKEHTDFHYAMRLSESLNGATEDSKNLSYGERRLLFSSAKRPAKTSQQGPSKKSHSQKKSDIYKYFSK